VRRRSGRSNSFELAPRCDFPSVAIQAPGGEKSRRTFWIALPNRQLGYILTGIKVRLTGQNLNSWAMAAWGCSLEPGKLFRSKILVAGGHRAEPASSDASLLDPVMEEVIGHAPAVHVGRVGERCGGYLK
jgi:hypothetical protein